MKLTPYDTGKVQIGLYYERPNNYSVSVDMEHIQTAYIGHGVEKPVAPFFIGLYVAALVSLALFWVCR
jgi:hypothetical protein